MGAGLGYRGVHRVAGRPGLGHLDLAEGPAVNRVEVGILERNPFDLVLLTVTFISM